MTDPKTNSDRNNEARVGVYVCHCGGNISSTVDVERVADAALKMPGVAFAQRNMFMCSDPGQDLIIEDIKNGRVNRVVVAACAPSLHETTFRSALLRAGLNPYLYIHANIREQVSFVHAGEEATSKAIAMVAAAVAKAREILPLQATSVQVIDHATVSRPPWIWQAVA
jgi:heterodisulfide reductase subunit A